MAIGDLSAAQARFRDYLAMATGLDPQVITAWIGAESGWGVTKPGHNYLNVGPGRRYADEVEAAQRTARLITTSDHYANVRTAAHLGRPAQQIAAIVESPWDAGHYTDESGQRGGKLAAVYRQLGGDLDLNLLDGDGISLFRPDTWLSLGLTLLFVLAGLGLVVLGAHRLVTGGTK